MKEEWKKLDGIVKYGEYYEVSNFGNVRSIDREIIDTKGRKYTIEGKNIKPIKDKYGYLIVGLHREQKQLIYKVHRLVLLAFMPIPNSHELQCNHINENKTDNRLLNLEWCDSKYNANFGSRNDVHKKAVLQIDKNTNKVINEFESASEAGRITGINVSCISSVARGNTVRKTAGGYKWKYKEGEEN